jgi:hypothetical protein
MGKYPNGLVAQSRTTVSKLWAFFSTFSKTHKMEHLFSFEAAQNLDGAVSRVNALRENFPGEYLIASQATGRRIQFTSNVE